MNKKPPLRTMWVSLSLAFALGIATFVCVMLEKKEAAQWIGIMALPFALFGIAMMVLCDLRARPPGE